MPGIAKEISGFYLPIVLLTVKIGLKMSSKALQPVRMTILRNRFLERVGARVARTQVEKAYVALEENAKLKREVELRRKRK